PKQRGRRREKADVKAVVAALPVQESNKLIKSSGPAARTGKGKAARSAIQQISVTDKDPERGPARHLFGNTHGGLFHAGGATVRPQEHAHAQRLAGSGFAFFEPGAFDGE